MEGPPSPRLRRAARGLYASLEAAIEFSRGGTDSVRNVLAIA